jgi:adenylosuccinate lyase
MTALTAISPIDGRYARVTKPLENYLSEFALMKYRVFVELEWLKFLCNAKLENIRPLTASEQQFLTDWQNNFTLEDASRIKEIERTTRHDVKAVEYAIREKLKGSSLEDVGEFVHFACTSEDINNLSYGLMLQGAYKHHLLPTMKKLLEDITHLAQQNKSVAMMARTHGQPASPTMLGKELAVFVYRLKRQVRQLEGQEFLGKFAGAVGNFNAHTSAYPDANWRKLAKDFVNGLGLTYNPLTTQIESHDFVAELFAAQGRFNQIALGFAQDIWQYISLGYFKQRLEQGEIGSSTMPHKVNPIDFENAEANFGLANASLQHLANKLQISRLQRDLSDSSAMRNVGVGLAHTLVALSSLLVGVGKLEVNLAAIAADLEGEWVLLAEPIQTVMRKYNVPNGYERMKDLTRGASVDAATMRGFIAGLEIPDADKKRLLEMTPQSYIGLAAELLEEIE